MFGPVQIGRLTLTEALAGPFAEKANTDTRERSGSVSGQESLPPLSSAELVQRHSDVLALPPGVVPVTFSDKTDRNGYYRVTGTSATMVNNQGALATSNWDVALERVGTEHEVDLESRLSGPQSRLNDFTITGERVHAPPIGSYAYSAGTTVPTTMTRTGSDGALTVYRGVPVATHPRWACPIGSYLNGRVRFLDSSGFERSGTDLVTTPTGWQLHNGLVRVSPSGTLLDVAAWSGGGWQSKLWDIRVGGTALGTPAAVTILRNTPELVTVRVLWTLTVGRATADFTLRRGARFVEVWLETQTAATVRVQRSTVEAGAAVTGGLAATANDAAGNRYWIATLRSGATTDTVNGALQKAATATLGLAVGAVVGGSGAVSGDAAADLIKQYAGNPAERVEAVRR